MRGLDVEHFDRTASVEDGDLDVTATISTAEGFRYRGGFTERVRSDNFLRAIIDKQSGATQIQLYQTIIYTGPWRQFRTANVQFPDGLRSVPLINIAGDVPTCAGGICVHEDHVAFEISEEELRRLVAGADRDVSRLWRFKFNATSGEDWEDNMSVAEIAGLLGRLDRYRSARR
jgi:hypothetical protein